MHLDLPNRATLALANNNEHEALKRFVLFNCDVEGAHTSFQLFDALRITLDPANNGVMMYHASCFVCAVRRTGRLLESLSSNRMYFRDPVREVVRLEWRKRRAFFDSFIEARNTIEHIDSEANAKTKWSFFNLHNDLLSVSDGVTVVIDDYAVRQIQTSRDTIAEAIVNAYPDTAFDMVTDLSSI